MKAFFLDHYRIIIFTIYTSLFLYFSTGTLNSQHAPSALFVKKIIAGIEDSKFSVRKIAGYSPLPHKDVVVVSVDERSINSFGRWPWNRKRVGELLEKMNKAVIVALDIVFSETSNQEEDDYLANVIGENNNIILGFFFRTDGTEDISKTSMAHLEDCTFTNFSQIDDTIGLAEYPHVEANIPILSAQSLSCGFFVTRPDPDGLYRRYPIANIYKKNIFPSLAIQSSRFFLNTDAELVLDKNGIKKFSLGNFEVKDSNLLRLNYYSDDVIQEVSAADILNGKIPSAFFKNKVVVLGVTEIAVYDIRPTPVDPFTPGVYLHYTAISNLLKNEFLKDSKFLNYLLIFTTLFMTFFISLLRNIFTRIFFYSLLVIAVFTLVNYLFIAKSLWLNFSFPLLTLMSCSTILEGFAFFISDIQALKLKKAFSSYVAPELVGEIIKKKKEISLGGEVKEVTILFSDIRGFTTLSEKLNPDKLVFLLNHYFAGMTKIIINQNGMLDKYIGDAIMALFNTPLPVNQHADKACNSALEMIKKLKEINVILESNGIPKIEIGIGLNTGLATVGNMGSSFRFDYTAVGDSVNLTSRIEGLNKDYRTSILISENTLKRLESKFLVRRIDKVRVKGKEIPVTIFELMEDNNNNLSISKEFDHALSLYFEKKLDLAKKEFSIIAGKYSDQPSEIFVKRCEFYIENDPGENWDGVYGGSH